MIPDPIPVLGYLNDLILVLLGIWLVVKLISPVILMDCREKAATVQEKPKNWIAGRRLRSITLRADAHHLSTDVWTSAGVVIGIFIVQLTGWIVLDAIVALLVAANIIG